MNLSDGSSKLLEHLLVGNGHIEAEVFQLLRKKWETKPHGSFSRFLASEQVLDSATAKTLEAAEKGYITLSGESFTLRFNADQKRRLKELSDSLHGEFTAPSVELTSSTDLPPANPATEATTEATLEPVALIPQKGQASQRISSLQGETIGGRYQLVSKLGEGSMGCVYKAKDLLLDDTIAIKIFLPRQVEGDQTRVERFKRELRVSRRLHHENIIQIHHFDSIDGMWLLLMEYFEGRSLESLMAQHRLSQESCLWLARQIAAGLRVAHEHGVVHRDVKPANVLVNQEGWVKVLDFGVARLLDVSSLTLDGSILGTPYYISPEQCLSGQVDERSDIYSFGCLFYEMLCGIPPVDGANLVSILRAHIETKPVPPSRHLPEIDPRLEALVMSCLSKDPQQRPASMSEVLTTLHTLSSDYQTT